MPIAGLEKQENLASDAGERSRTLLVIHLRKAQMWRTARPR